MFGDNSHFTDGTVMTFAVAEALMNGGEPEHYVAAMQKFGRCYPDTGYGNSFAPWLRSDDPKPYHSFGNGAAMRVLPVARWCKTLVLVEEGSEASAAVTHNHPEGIKEAQSTAAAIFLAANGESKDVIRSHIESRYGYDLSRTLDEIRPHYRFDESCQGTVPEAITAFLESDGFEDAIRKAVSLGGDSDTLAAVTGSIAEAAYGVPEKIKKKALSRLDGALLSVLECWQNAIKDASIYIADTCGKWFSLLRHTPQSGGRRVGCRLWQNRKELFT